MLRISQGSARSLCDGLSRRQFLEVGSLGAFGLSLSSLLRHEALAADDSNRKSQRTSKRSAWWISSPSRLLIRDASHTRPETQ